MNKVFVIILAVIIAWIIGYVCYQGGKMLWAYKDVSIVVKIVLSIIGAASGIGIGILSWLGLLSFQKE